MTQPEDQSASSLEERAAACKSNAEQFRMQVKGWYAWAREQGTPEAFRQALESIRSIQDGMEDYVSLAVSIKGALSRAAMDAQLHYDEDWAKEASHSARSRRGEEMEGPRERYARFDLKVFDQLRAVRQAEKQRALAQELLDDMWLRYRAINATRDDLHQILRAFQFERVLER